MYMKLRKITGKEWSITGDCILLNTKNSELIKRNQGQSKFNVRELVTLETIDGREIQVELVVSSTHHKAQNHTFFNYHFPIIKVASKVEGMDYMKGIFALSILEKQFFKNYIIDSISGDNITLVTSSYTYCGGISQGRFDGHGLLEIDITDQLEFYRLLGKMIRQDKFATEIVGEKGVKLRYTGYFKNGMYKEGKLSLIIDEEPIYTLEGAFSRKKAPVRNEAIVYSNFIGQLQQNLGGNKKVCSIIDIYDDEVVLLGN